MGTHDLTNYVNVMAESPYKPSLNTENTAVMGQVFERAKRAASAFGHRAHHKREDMTGGLCATSTNLKLLRVETPDLTSMKRNQNTGEQITRASSSRFLSAKKTFNQRNPSASAGVPLKSTADASQASFAISAKRGSFE